MDELILRHLGGEATDVEQHRLEKWRAASSANDTRYRELEALWRGLGSLSTKDAAGRRPDVDAMIAEAERRRERSRASRSRRAVLRSPRLAYGVAAAAAILLAFFGWRGWVGGGPGPAFAPVESSLGSGRVVAMTLSDGSFLRAAEGASLQFPAEPGRREVVLDGRAFFAVAPGDEPFVVRTAAGELRVHGTRFEVRAEREALRVVVVEGSVEVIGPGGRADLGAGQMGMLRGGGAPEVATVEDVWALLDWPSGLLAFQRTPLGDVAGQIEHRFGVDVRIQDSQLAGRRITGSFRDDSLDEVLETVCAATGIRCTRQGETFVLGTPPE